MITTPDLEPQPSAAEAANPVVEADRVAGGVEPRAEEGQKRRRINLGMDRFSGLYVWAALIILFSFWVPDTFPTTDNAKIIAGDQAITAMLALGIIIPLAAGVFDLSFAGVLGVSVAIVGYLQSNGYSAWLVGDRRHRGGSVHRGRQRVYRRPTTRQLVHRHAGYE